MFEKPVVLLCYMHVSMLDLPALFDSRSVFGLPNALFERLSFMSLVPQRKCLDMPISTSVGERDEIRKGFTELQRELRE